MGGWENNKKMKRKHYFISGQTGKLLERLIILTKSKSILEIGTGEGYSTSFLAKAAKQTKGKIITIEQDKGSAEKALKNLKQVKLSEFVEIKTGDALEILKKLNKKFDFVFIDGKKRDYLNYLKSLNKKLNKNCMVIAHNVISHKDKVPDYLKFVKKKFCSYTLPFDKGIEISIKKAKNRLR